MNYYAVSNGLCEVFFGHPGGVITRGTAPLVIILRGAVLSDTEHNITDVAVAKIVNNRHTGRILNHKNSQPVRQQASNSTTGKQQNSTYIIKATVKV
jgi:hypothetical protein